MILTLIAAATASIGSLSSNHPLYFCVEGGKYDATELTIENGTRFSVSPNTPNSGIKD